jgi:hypothetical protein
MGKEYLSAVRTALAQEDCHVAELPTVGDAQELA